MSAKKSASKPAPQNMPAARPVPDMSAHAAHYKRQRDHIELQLIAAQQENVRLREQIELLEAENENVTRSLGASDEA